MIKREPDIVNEQCHQCGAQTTVLVYLLFEDNIIKYAIRCQVCLTQSIEAETENETIENWLNGKFI